MATCSFALLPVWQHVAVPSSPTAVHCCTACLSLCCACTCAATCSFALNCKLAMRCHTACLPLYDACNCMGDRWMCDMCLRVIYMCIAIVFNNFLTDWSEYQTMLLLPCLLLLRPPFVSARSLHKKENCIGLRSMQRVRYIHRARLVLNRRVHSSTCQHAKSSQNCC